MRRLCCSLLVWLAACGAAPVTPVSPDAGTTAQADAQPSPVDGPDASTAPDAAQPDAAAADAMLAACETTTVGRLSVSEGGRGELALVVDVEVEASAGLSATVRDGKLEVWSAYGALAAQTLTLRGLRRRGGGRRGSSARVDAGGQLGSGHRGSARA